MSLLSLTEGSSTLLDDPVCVVLTHVVEGDAPEMVRALGGLVHLLPRSATRDTVRHSRTEGKEGKETHHTSEA